MHNIKSKSEKRARRNELKQLAAKVQWVVFLYLLRRFFLTGSEAAEEAVRIFAELKIEKFKIGKKEFFEGSDSVKEGKVLAERLMDAISDKKIKKLILESVWASDIIYHYRNKLYKDQDVYFFDRAQSRTDLRDFFKSSKAKLNSFGSTVNQTVEAYVFAEVIKLHDERGWRVQLKNPKVKNQDVFRLKFSTRGKPDNFSYAVATRDNETFQIRHGLRVSIYNDGEHTRANICCDVAVIKDDDLSRFNTDDPVPNDWLISFAEVKHMSAYPELLAS
ncbi:MAG TPA: hypothetical protein VIJ14_04005, partial [Rhabdochlamydiaceae bacterium]